jgi:hypothetical protein
MLDLLYGNIFEGIHVYLMRDQKFKSTQQRSLRADFMVGN